mmetsp:Transcript_24922/g.23925  ORF Transcript_24922/g.23925 Transcript_24922/m.23925 type:complete len:192 (-) Transcript_24922:140-715(-)|eukprot:CAMPEP_0197832400 /NCGR_PEP_ID=MMETSP1437-20131217/14604_1 /TAXON_ID=49252 ORGANISM="Eucampia antarctica, Strain CCMP1452" /NCGR_SAMPLE_ID=MMETSP1437 /ASSEMBLY_ACC=CAM_ASM_001096 /LENGTH=191 /DNA_ID=CAMNT_0043435765 /DNA_START=42 /DNA_END=617 /DNA_ORIENTATION=+
MTRVANGNFSANYVDYNHQDEDKIKSNMKMLGESHNEQEKHHTDKFVRKRNRRHTVDYDCSNEKPIDKEVPSLHQRRGSRRRSHSLLTGSDMSQKFFQGTLTPVCEKQASEALFDAGNTPKYQRWNDPHLDAGIVRTKIVCLDIPSEVMIHQAPQITEHSTIGSDPSDKNEDKKRPSTTTGDTPCCTCIIL